MDYYTTFNFIMVDGGIKTHHYRKKSMNHKTKEQERSNGINELKDSK